jgi:hypothetical protein
MNCGPALPAKPAAPGQDSCFRGGVSEDSKKYLVVKAGPCRDVRVHILVAEAMLRRKLKKDEHVHHRDGDEKNPRWTNLLVIDHTTHGAVSSRQYWYLKQKYSREEAAWRAFEDVTGKTYDQYSAAFDVAELEAQDVQNSA